MIPYLINRPRTRQIAIAVTLSLGALTTAIADGAQAHAAADAVIHLDCQDSQKTFKVWVTLVGSGAPKAKYDVTFTTVDYTEDAWRPKVRLVSLNQDGSITNYPWHVGGQGASVLTDFPTTTLQQPKGLKAVMVEGSSSPEVTEYHCISKAVGHS